MMHLAAVTVHVFRKPKANISLGLRTLDKMNWKLNQETIVIHGRLTPNYHTRCTNQERLSETPKYVEEKDALFNIVLYTQVLHKVSDTPTKLTHWSKS